MKHLALSILAFAAFSICVSAVAEKSRPMDEMHGNCSNYKIDLSKEFEIWKRQPIAIEARQSQAIPIAQGIELKLEDEKSAQFTSPPQKVFKFDGQRFGGVYKFKTKSAGLYRISVGGRLWFDLVDAQSKKILDPETFEMQTGCGTIFKSVAFRLEADTNYWIQVSSSGVEKARILVSHH